MRKIAAIFFLLLVSNLHAQQPTEDQAVWMAYTGQFKFTKHFGTHLEAQWRSDDALKQNRQNLFRAGLIYYVAAQTSITAGYGLINTYNYGLNAFFREDRVWEQLQFYHNLISENNSMLHRFRLEQRWVDQLALNGSDVVVGATNYQNRLRYLNRMLFQIAELKSNKTIYLLLQNELFFILGENKINNHLLDQNRFTAGLGVNVQNQTRFEVGYLNHYVNPMSDNPVINHTLSLAIFHNISFAD